MSANGERIEDASQFIKVSAPGKVILHGEHAVVYGKLAVALSVDLRTNLTIAVGGDSVTIDLPIVDMKQTWPLDTFKKLHAKIKTTGDNTEPKALTKEQSQHLRNFLDIGEEVVDPQKLAMLSFFHLYLSILPQALPMYITVSSQLPTSAGLGSSAAYAVCLSSALLHLSGNIDLNQLSSTTKDLSAAILDSVCKWAFISEQIVHGTPSGIDNSVCTYGDAVSFKSGKLTPLQVPALKVLLVNTKVPRSTKALVSGVRERRERLPEVINPILDSLDALSVQGLQVLQKLIDVGEGEEHDSAIKLLEELIDINQALLCSIGVSHASLDKLVGIARSHGLHAKLTGAGGGGCGIVVLSPSISDTTVNACCEELKQSGYEVWSTSLGAPGITFHV